MTDQAKDKGSRTLVRATDSGAANARPSAGGANPRDLGALTGMRRLRLLQGRLEAGATECELPGETRDEMFLQIIAGSGVLECDGQRVSLAAGDLLSIAYPDSGPILRNTGAQPLIWLMGSHRTD